MLKIERHATRAGVVAVLAWVTLTAPALPAQEPGDSVRLELARLRARIDSLAEALRELQEAGPAEPAADPLAELRALAAAAAREGSAQPEPTAEVAQFEGRQRSLQALNPEISVNVDIFAHLDTDDADDQNFVPREFEFSFQSALDPFSRAKIFVTHHAVGPELEPFEESDAQGHEGEEEGGVEIEEGWVEWVGLPAGLSLKLGKFFQRFGALNRWHAHALPFQSRSLPHIAFLGEESLAQAGGSLSWLLPIHGVGTYDATVEVARSSNTALFGESTRPSVLGHLNGFWQLSEATDLDLGLSWMNGSFEDEESFFDRNLYGVEGALTWRPPERSRYRELVIRGGAMLLEGLAHQDVSEGDGEAKEKEAGAGSAMGFWSSAELRLSPQWLIGARFDRVEDPDDSLDTATLLSPTLTWWQSEYVRIRLEYDHLARSAADDAEGRFWLQVTFALGPHRHETY